MKKLNLNKINRALVSVSDKTDLIKLAAFLTKNSVEILSTGGSAKYLLDAGIPVKGVSEHTGFPEIMDGRVKTLHPKIHGGILARRSEPSHLNALDEHAIDPIDMIVVNLYPFEETVLGGANFESCIENIDIGGPSLIRAAAKNHESITVVTDPKDYDAIITSMTENRGATTPKLRRHLATAAYATTAAYDIAISRWFSEQNGDEFPQHHALIGTRAQVMRYGENPHQAAAFYRTSNNRFGVGTATQLQGKELSYNNLNDTDAAFDLVAEFNDPAVAIIKHANPCGVAIGNSISEAYECALKCDPVSAFGGIIAINRKLDTATAAKMADLFLEVIIAPQITESAKDILASKKNLRVLITDEMPEPSMGGQTLKMLAGGFLLQDRDTAQVTIADLKTVTKRPPSDQELLDLIFAFTVCKHVKSNAIVYAKDGATVGIGAGQMSRIDSCRIAAQKAIDAAEAAGENKPLTQGSVVASDAFFPFADGLLAAAAAGVTAVIQPGGSIRDEEVVAAADENDLAMVLTGVRHFRH
ncbi:MAG: bifunctional phosphoribosylaminoimidazolecarboxamide formyltransferase/inosine monophosphate cyclohydrolase [Legionellales bacterium]|nr:bifunctional phosphoribosylaminoimidazolecarboxamide formyltransferase/inosine monophosphate cyclohydrolase [Legionellales bacterium]